MCVFLLLLLLLPLKAVVPKMTSSMAALDVIDRLVCVHVCVSVRACVCVHV